MRLAGHLMKLGFVLMDFKPNEKYPNKNVFYFIESIQLKEAVQKYLNKA